MLFEKSLIEERDECAYFMARKRHIARFFGALLYSALALLLVTYIAVWVSSWSRYAALLLGTLIVALAFRSALKLTVAVLQQCAQSEPLLLRAGQWVLLSQLLKVLLFVAAILALYLALFHWEPAATGG